MCRPVWFEPRRKAGKMGKNSYMLAGQFRGGKHDGLGLSLFRANADGTLAHLQTVRDDLAAGWFCMDTDRKLIYAVQEKGSMNGRLGGGSCIYTFKFDSERELLDEVGCARTLSPTPSYICEDRERKHVIVAHNGSSGRITKIIKNEDGNYRTETVFDDAAVVVLSLDDNGVPTGISDLFVARNEGEFGQRAIINEYPGGPAGIMANPGTAAHLHCATLSPDGRVLICCDFGQGKIHSFRYDGEKGRLSHAAEYEEPVDSGVRYAIFHPILPLVYINCENRPAIFIYSYDRESGELHRVGECPTLPEADGIGCRDIIINPEGSRLYLTVNNNSICVMDVLPNGEIKFRGTVPCLGNAPRTLALSPDGKFLYCGCNRSGTVEVYEVGEDGMPSGGRITAEGVSASAMKLFS